MNNMCNKSNNMYVMMYQRGGIQMLYRSHVFDSIETCVRQTLDTIQDWCIGCNSCCDYITVSKGMSVNYGYKIVNDEMLCFCDKCKNIETGLSNIDTYDDILELAINVLSNGKGRWFPLNGDLTLNGHMKLFVKQLDYVPDQLTKAAR